MSKLFSGLRIGQLELAHRLVTTVDARAHLDVAGYRRRATPGGLIITENSATASRDHWAKATDAIHGAGGLVVALLSPVSERRLARDIDVDAAMDDYQRLARLARAAAFDGVELDAGASALADRFLQPCTNARPDDYGGDAERRMRFLLEASYVVAAEFSPERTGVRLSPCARAGQVEVVADVMRAISERELAYVHLAHERPSSTRPPPAESVSIAACAERQAFRSDVSCALLASDLVDLDVAMSAVERRWADAIGFLQADDDPDFVARTVREHLDA